MLFEGWHRDLGGETGRRQLFGSPGLRSCQAGVPPGPGLAAVPKKGPYISGLTGHRGPEKQLLSVTQVL